MQRLAAPADRGVRRDADPARGAHVFSTFVNAPLRELANPNLTPNPSKAPWYFLGLQELLRYFHPMVAGITIPTFMLRRARGGPLRGPQPEHQARRPQDRDHDVHDAVHVRRDRSRSSARSSAAPATTGSGRGRKGCSSSYEHSLALSNGTVARSSSSVVAATCSRSIFGLLVRPRARTEPSSDAAAGADRRATRSRPSAVSRRDFFRALAARVAAACSAPQFGGATIAFLWPNLKGGFGSVINAGNARRHQGADQRPTTAVYSGAGRFYIVAVERPAGGRRPTTRPRASPPRASCPCTSAACTSGAGSRSARSSQWFECPCHGSKYNRAGRVQAGPGAARAWTASRSRSSTAT